MRLLKYLAVCAVAILPFSSHGGGGLSISVSGSASDLERVAANEIRRYLYLRTGELAPLETRAAGACIVVGSKDSDVVRESIGADATLGAEIRDLGPQQYRIRTLESSSKVLISGGDALGTLYGAYRFAEHIGVRFYLHGDVLPDGRMPLKIPVIDDRGKPLFETRGIQPFHDFPEGPDWWNLDDYKAILAQRRCSIGMTTARTTCARLRKWTMLKWPTMNGSRASAICFAMPLPLQRLQNIPLIAESAEALRQALGEEFPEDARLSKEYNGPPRVLSRRSGGASRRARR